MSVNNDKLKDALAKPPLPTTGVMPPHRIIELERENRELRAELIAEHDKVTRAQNDLMAALEGNRRLREELMQTRQQLEYVTGCSE
jgi:hypothetical protein